MLLTDHPPILETRTFSWPDESACAAFAVRLARAPSLFPSTFIALAGPLGAGKTTFVRHLLRALGVQGRIKSPTYAVMEPYEIDGRAVSHFDFYRLESADEALRFGLDDYLGESAILAIEWAGKFPALLPASTRWLRFRAGDGDQRTSELP